MTMVIRMTRVVNIRSRGILWIVIQILYIYIVMNGSKDQKLDLSYGNIFTHTRTHTHTHTLLVYLHAFTMYLLCIFIKCVLSSNLRYSLHMHQLMNFDFLEYD